MSTSRNLWSLPPSPRRTRCRSLLLCSSRQNLTNLTLDCTPRLIWDVTLLTYHWPTPHRFLAKSVWVDRLVWGASEFGLTISRPISGGVVLAPRHYTSPRWRPPRSGPSWSLSSGCCSTFATQKQTPSGRWCCWGFRHIEVGTQYRAEQEPARMVGIWQEQGLVQPSFLTDQTYLSVEESQTRISSWCSRWGSGAPAGAGEISNLVAAARDTAIMIRRKERGVTGSGGTDCDTKITLKVIIYLNKCWCTIRNNGQRKVRLERNFPLDVQMTPGY